MMKKTQIIDLIKTILAEKVSFFSISLFIAFGVALYCGIAWTVNACANVFETNYNESNVRTYDVSFPYGINDEDITKFKEETGSDYAEGSYCCNTYFKYDNVRYQALLVQLSTNINAPIRQEGELPKNANEIAVEKHWANKYGVEIGDTVKFEHDDDGNSHIISNIENTDVDNLDYENFSLKYDSPCGMSKLKNDKFKITALIENGVYLNEKSESYGVNYENCTPIDCVMFLHEDSFDRDAFNGYTNVMLTNNDINNINTFSDEFYDVNREQKNKIDEIAKKYSDEAYNRILNKSKSIKNKFQTKVDDSQNKLNITKQAALLATSTSTQISSLQSNNLASAQNQIDDAKNNISAFDQFIDTFTYWDVYTNSKTELPSYCLFQIFKQILMQMRISLVLIFVIIGLLVCYSTLSRMVANQAVLIGIKKANGCPLRHLRSYFLLYGVLTLIIGYIAAIVLGAIPIELIIQNTIGGCFVVYDPIIYLNFADFAIIAGVYAVIIIVTTLVSTNKILRHRAINLVSGQYTHSIIKKSSIKIPGSGHLTTLSQTVIGNLISEKKRVFGTVVGVVGCTALLVTAFVFRANILESFDVQYNNYYNFDHVIYFDPDNDTAQDSIIKILESENIDATPVMFDRAVIDNYEKTYSAKLFISDQQPIFNNMIKYYDDNGECEVVDKTHLSNSYVKDCDLNDNSVLNIVGIDGGKYQLTNIAPVNNYLVEVTSYLSDKTYKDIFSKDIKKNCLLIKMPSDKNIKTINDKLMNIDGYLFSRDYKYQTHDEYELIGNITFIMSAIYLFLSFLMAVFVLLTIFKISIAEKKKQIIVLRINGYKLSKVIKYVYSDTIFLTIISIVLGFILGEINGNLAILGFETFATSFLMCVNIPPAIIGAAIALILAIIMGLISLKDLKILNINDLDSTD